VHRRDLDDYDSKSWKADENGDLVDPWQQTTLLVLVSPAEPHDLFTFSTSTEGGKSALNDLCIAHARTTENLGEYPIVTLKTGSYLHKIKSRGRIEVPVFEVVNRVEADRFNAIVAGARGGAGFIPTTLPASERLEIDGPPAPSAPLVEKYEGPDDGSDDGIEDTDFDPCANSGRPRRRGAYRRADPVAGSRDEVRDCVTACSR
jgi:hypothetical protein